MGKPQSGVIGIPAGLKEAGKRVDFKPDDFDLMIETKGYRFAWSRSALCPCNKVSDDVAVDPNCSLCKGDGWLYFAPSEPVSEVLTGELSSLQKKILEHKSAAIVRGIMTGVLQEFDPYNKIGNWVDGEGYVTVRWQNRLGYYDRLVNFDAEIVYSELKPQPAAGANIKLRYSAIGVNLLCSFTQEYLPDVHFEVVDGEIKWLGSHAPVADTRLAIHYTTYPTYLVVMHPNAVRTTPVKFKTATPSTPQGDPRFLPIKAHVKYEFLEHA